MDWFRIRFNGNLHQTPKLISLEYTIGLEVSNGKITVCSVSFILINFGLPLPCRHKIILGIATGITLTE